MIDFSLPVNLYLYSAMAIAGIGVVALFIFRSMSVKSVRMRIILFILRSAGLAILLLILANPVRKKGEEHSKAHNQHFFLVDTSESMSLDQPQTRLQKVQELISSSISDSQIENHIQLFRFDSKLHMRLDNENQLTLTPQGALTNMGSSLTDLLRVAPDNSVANIVVFTDGIIHDRPQLGEAIRLAVREGIPVSTYTAASNKVFCNLSIHNCILDRRCPPGSRIPVRVLVAAKGTAGQEIKLELKNKAGNLCGEVNFTVHEGLNEQVIQLDTGARSDEYTLELSRIRGEITHSDNTFGFKVEVSEPKIHVLYMEGSNHTKYGISTNHLNLGTSSGGRRIWEYQFLERAFLETGLIDVDVFTVNIQRMRGGRLYHVKDKNRGFPTTREELFKYDVIICSDINRYIFTEEQLEWTVELVASRGGGFCMIGGRTSFGAGLWQETIWEQMIPVAMDTGEQDFLGYGFNPIFPDEVRNHPILQIDSDFSQNNEILDNHPRFRGANFVKRAKPGATVLAYAAPSKQYDTDDFHLYASSTSSPVRIRSIQSPKDPNTPVEERVPTICVQSYGKGRSMAFTSDAAGWWGDFYQTQWGEEGHDNRYYNKFWVNAVRWLAENSLARHRSKLVGNTESVNYKPGEAVRVRAQILVDEDTTKLQSNKVTAHLDLEASKSIELRFDPDRKEYLGDLRLPSEVEQSDVTVLFHATNSTDRLIGEDKIPIRVITLKKEFVDPTPDPHLLGEIARLTGGRTIKDQSDLRDLLRGNMNNKTMELRFYKVPLWDHPLLWGLLILLFGTEWIIRKVISFR